MGSTASLMVSLPSKQIMLPRQARKLNTYLPRSIISVSPVTDVVRCDQNWRICNENLNISKFKTSFNTIIQAEMILHNENIFIIVDSYETVIFLKQRLL